MRMWSFSWLPELAREWVFFGVLRTDTSVLETKDPLLVFWTGACVSGLQGECWGLGRLPFERTAVVVLGV